MNFLPKNEFEYQLYALAIYYYTKAKVKENKKQMERLKRKIENELGVKAIPYDKITSGTSVVYSNNSALTKSQGELLTLEAETQKYSDILNFINLKYNYEKLYELLNDDDKQFIYAIFFKGLSVKEVALELDMNERYVQRKVKRIISEMTGCVEDE